MSQFDVKMNELADKIKSKNTAVTGKLSVQGMIEAVNGITIGGGAGDSTVKFGYWTTDGKFQEVDLSGDAPVVAGEPIVVDANTFATGQPAPEYPESGGGNAIAEYGVMGTDGTFQALDLSGDTPVDSGVPQNMSELTMYNTGRNEPDYPTGGGSGGGTGGGMKFYECAEYTPEFAGGLQYSFTLSDVSEDNTLDVTAAGTYIRTKWVDDTSNIEDYAETARWENENGWRFIENYDGSMDSFSYTLENKDNTKSYGTDEPLDRVNDYNTLAIYDWDVWETIAVQFSAWQTEELPATTESWSGYEMTQNGESGAWVKAESLTDNLEIKGYTPEVGKIYSADTTVRIGKLYDGTTYPVPSNGLIAYFPLKSDFIDETGNYFPAVTTATFEEKYGRQAMKATGGGYAEWTGTSNTTQGALSIFCAVTGINYSSWNGFVSVGEAISTMFGLDNFGGKMNGRIGSDWGTFGSLSTSQWDTIAMTRDAAGNYAMYLNGICVAEKTQSPITSVNTQYIDAGYCRGAHKANCYISDYCVYDRALTADEVIAMHREVLGL